MKYLLGFFVSVIVLAGASYLLFKNQTNNPTISAPTNNISSTPSSNIRGKTEANFAIYTNGTFRIFTDSRYHNRSQDVFISSANPNVVNVRKKGTTWNYFFKTLPMKLTKDCLTTGTGQIFCSNQTHTLKFFINGTKDDEALDREIKNEDQLLVSYGPKEDKNIELQLQNLQNPKLSE